MSRIAQVLSGPDATPSTYLFARRLFVMLLALVALVSLGDLWADAHELVGEAGIVPLDRVASWAQHAQPKGVLSMPSVYWLARGDAAISIVCGLSMLGAVAVLCGRFVRTGLALAATAWLSMLALAIPPAGIDVELGNPFMGFESDGLLLEACVLGLLLVPSRLAWSTRVGGGVLFLLRLLLLRVLVLDAIARLAPGGAWSSTELFVRHLWTAPVPTRLGLLMAEAPAFVQGALRTVMVSASLIAPLFVFGPRRLRMLAFLALTLVAGWTAVIETRGPWPILVFGLALFALDDQTLARALRRSAPTEFAPRARHGLFTAMRATVIVVLLALAGLVSIDSLRGSMSELHARVAPWFLCNGYGARFAVPDVHPVLVLEASADGETYLRLDPRVAPGDLLRAPALSGLVVPRFDVRLEYAARSLAGGEEPPLWLLSTVAALLEGRGGVRGLFADGAFVTEPPRFVRLRVRSFTPAEPAERSRSGMWWFQGGDLAAARHYALQDGVLSETGR